MVNRCRSIGSAMHEDVRGLLNPDESGATLASLSQIEDGGFAEAEATIDGGAESLILHRDGDAVRARSEEHTSELQSLMRISYAVFCLKKKTKTNHSTHICS